jgi:hypothetical protein
MLQSDPIQEKRLENRLADWLWLLARWVETKQQLLSNGEQLV